jgi:hypothetical protein
MSKHGLTLEVIETLRPWYTVGTCADDSDYEFPDELAVMAVRDFRRNKADGGLRFTGHRDEAKRAGTVVGVFREKTTRPRVFCLRETAKQDAPLQALARQKKTPAASTRRPSAPN